MALRRRCTQRHWRGASQQFAQWQQHANKSRRQGRSSDAARLTLALLRMHQDNPAVIALSARPPQWHSSLTSRAGCPDSPGPVSTGKPRPRPRASYVLMTFQGSAVAYATTSKQKAPLLALLDHLKAEGTLAGIVGQNPGQNPYVTSLQAGNRIPSNGNKKGPLLLVKSTKLKSKFCTYLLRVPVHYARRRHR